MKLLQLCASQVRRPQATVMSLDVLVREMGLADEESSVLQGLVQHEGLHDPFSPDPRVLPIEQLGRAEHETETVRAIVQRLNRLHGRCMGGHIVLYQMLSFWSLQQGQLTYRFAPEFMALLFG